MGRLVRRSLFDKVAERLPVSTTALVAIVVGAVTLFFFCKRKGAAQRPALTVRRPVSAPKKESEPSDVLTQIRQKTFVGKRVCIAWEVLHDGAAWTAGGKALSMLQFYAFTSEVFLMCRVAGADDRQRIWNLVKGIDGIVRHRVLFCTTEKGYEAFTRQLNPSLLITYDAAQVAFLKRVIHTLVLVGDAGTVAASNVLCVPSVALIAGDAE